MKMLKGGLAIAESDDWFSLVWKAERKQPPVTLSRCAPWWVADAGRTEDVSLETLMDAVEEETCPFEGASLPNGEDEFYKAAAGFWVWCRDHFTSEGIIRAIRAASAQPVKTPEQLACLYAEDCGYTIVE